MGANKSTRLHLRRTDAPGIAGREETPMIETTQHAHLETQVEIDPSPEIVRHHVLTIETIVGTDTTIGGETVEINTVKETEEIAGTEMDITTRGAAAGIEDSTTEVLDELHTAAVTGRLAVTGIGTELRIGGDIVTTEETATEETIAENGATVATADITVEISRQNVIGMIVTEDHVLQKAREQGTTAKNQKTKTISFEHGLPNETKGFSSPSRGGNTVQKTYRSKTFTLNSEYI